MLHIVVFWAHTFLRLDTFGIDLRGVTPILYILHFMMILGSKYFLLIALLKSIFRKYRVA